MNYSEKLQAMGLTESQIGTILSGWPCGAIEALLRGDLTPPSEEGIASAIMACGAD